MEISREAIGGWEFGPAKLLYGSISGKALFSVS
jgi:hypothetical protein